MAGGGYSYEMMKIVFLSYTFNNVVPSLCVEHNTNDMLPVHLTLCLSFACMALSNWLLPPFHFLWPNYILQSHAPHWYFLCSKHSNANYFRCKLLEMKKKKQAVHK